MSHLTRGSTSSQTARSSCRSRRSERGRGFPRFCRCGEKAVIKTSRTVKNPGRLFYSCPYGSEEDKNHLFTWKDERVVEEVEDLKTSVRGLEDELSEIRSDMVSLSKHLEQNPTLCCVIL